MLFTQYKSVHPLQDIEPANFRTRGNSLAYAATHYLHSMGVDIVELMHEHCPQRTHMGTGKLKDKYTEEEGIIFIIK